MSKITLKDISSNTGLPIGVSNVINENNNLIEAAIENTLSRNGDKPNQMNADLDLNDNDILNVGTIQVSDITVDGENVTGVIERAESAAASASISASLAISADLSSAIHEANAESAAEEAVAAASSSQTELDSRAFAISSYHPISAPNKIRTAGYFDPGDFGSALYKKVNSEPSHEGKFSITLEGGSVVWYEIAEPEIHISMLGAKMDGTNDDADALENAYNIGRPVLIGPGRIRLGRKVTFDKDYPVLLRGTGSDITYGTEQKHPNTTTLIGDHEDECVLEIATSSAASGESMHLSGFEVSGKPSNPPANQHGMIIRNRSHWSIYDDLVFSGLTGLGIAYDPTYNTYSQNISIRDTGFFTTGGDVGLTQEPSNGQNYLACTLMVINNVNHDHGINSVSPSSYLWDLRAFRHINATVFLEEGSGNPSTVGLVALAASGAYTFDTLHHEFTTDKPEVSFWIDGDSNGKYYGGSELVVRITNIGSPFKFKFDAGVEAQVWVADWVYYNAASPDDLVEFASNTGGHLVVERLHVKTPFTVPMHLSGQLDIVSVRCMDQLAPMLEQDATKIASWRPDNGAPLSFNTHVLAFTTANLASSDIEEDNNDNRLQVWRGTSNVGTAPTLRCQINVPFDWLEITLNYESKTDAFTVGSVLTGGTSGARAKIIANTDNGTTGTLKLKMLTATDFSAGETITDAASGSATVNGSVTKQGPWMTLVVRWKMTIDDTDIASGISGSITSPATAVWSMNRTQSGYNDEWRTAVMLFRPNSSQVTSSWAITGGVPANAIVIRVAAVDLYLGRRWSEPLDLSYT